MKSAIADKCNWKYSLVWKSTKQSDTVAREQPREQPAGPAATGFAEGLDPVDATYAAQVVARILEGAISARATDVHFEARNGQTHLRWRVDGTLIDCGTVPQGQHTSIINRLKALARLITYRTDIPQEGRLVLAEHQLEARVGTLPTLHGERAVLRLVTGRTKLLSMEQLGLEPEMLLQLQRSLDASSGVILISGPAGSGKTTTAYACLRM